MQKGWSDKISKTLFIFNCKSSQSIFSHSSSNDIAKLSALDALSNINSTDLIEIQIKEIYNKLEQMHDNRKKIESATNYL